MSTDCTGAASLVSEMNSRRFLVRVSTLKRDILNETMKSQTLGTHEPACTREALLQENISLRQDLSLLQREMAHLRLTTDVGSVSGLMKSVQRYQQTVRDGSATSVALDALMTHLAEFLRANSCSGICPVCKKSM